MRHINFVCMALAASLAVSCSAIKEKEEMKKMEACKEYFAQVIKELSTDSIYFGRNDYNNGDIKAAKYIIDQIVEIGGIPTSQSPMAVMNDEQENCPPYKSPVHPLGGLGRWETVVGNDCESAEYQKYVPFLQNFCFDLNVMRGAMSFRVDGKDMVPTVDFVAKEFCPSCKGKFEVRYLDDQYYTPELFVKHLNSGEYRNSFVVVDWKKYQTLPFETHMERYIPYLLPLDKVGGIILKDEGGSYSPNVQFPYFKARSYFTTPEPVLFVNGTFPTDAKEIELEIESEVIKNHDAHNVVAFLPGSGTNAKEDECITFIAHYDHLGIMGTESVFPGANDNASGVAMLLSLMKYFKEAEHSMPLQFIFLDSEESNLLGAFYNVANSRIPLEKIKCVMNCDMVGDSGDTLECQCEKNGQWIIDALRKINDNSTDGFKDFNIERVDDNSDHYAYQQAGIPATYFETKGEFYDHYHTPRDTYEHTTTYNYHRMFTLFTKFVRSFNE